MSLRRTSARLRQEGRRKAAPVAKTAETLVCRSLGIVQDRQDVTIAALDVLAKKFKEQLPSKVMAALRALFKVDDDHALIIENALIDHGGEDALDHEDASGEAAAMTAASD